MNIWQTESGGRRGVAKCVSMTAKYIFEVREVCTIKPS